MFTCLPACQFKGSHSTLWHQLTYELGLKLLVGGQTVSGRSYFIEINMCEIIKIKGDQMRRFWGTPMYDIVIIPLLVCLPVYY